MNAVNNTPMIPSRGYSHRIKRLLLKSDLSPFAERSIEGILPLGRADVLEVRRVFSSNDVGLKKLGI